MTRRQHRINSLHTGVWLRMLAFFFIANCYFLCLGAQDTAEIGSEYRLKVGDTLMIAIYGEDNSSREVVVDPRGTISYLYIDSLPAIGKTVAEIREELTEHLRRYYRFLVLLITPVKFNADYYTIAGEVNNPGRQPIVGRSTILSAICKAAGFTTRDFRDQMIDLCDMERSFLARDGDYVPVDFVRLVNHGDLTQDLPLQAGDYLYFPSSTVKQVFVLGEVLSPVTIDYFNTMSLVEAIAEAGDVTDYASNRVLVLRGSLVWPVRYLIDFNRIVKGCACDFALQPGDIVYVPQRRFTTAREIFRAAVREFVYVVSSVGGTEAFIKIHPHAGEADGLSSPVFFGN